MIEVRNLRKSFNDIEILKGLSITVEKGETVTILGRSGVGKSVLLKHIIGISKPDAGTIDVDGKRISELRGNSLYKATINMGMLFQGAALFDSMNVAENTAFFLKEHGDLSAGKYYTKAEIKELVDHALEVVGLQDVHEKMPSDLSGGMRKRAALARLIVYRPQYILYDEPTTGLDPITAMQINEFIVKTQQELKATSIVVTHDIVSALFVSDRLALHKDGVIAYSDEPEAFLEIDDPIIAFMKKQISQDPRAIRRRQ